MMICPKDAVESRGSKIQIPGRPIKVTSYTWNGSVGGLTSQLPNGHATKSGLPTCFHLQWETSETILSTSTMRVTNREVSLNVMEGPNQ